MLFLYVVTANNQTNIFPLSLSLKFRFRVFHTPIALKPENAEAVIMASCVLYNLIRIRNPSLIEGDTLDEATNEVIEGAWRQDASIPSVSIPPTRASQVGKEQRNYLRNYFSSPEGSVPWQLSRIQVSTNNFFFLQIVQWCYSFHFRYVSQEVGTSRPIS